MQASLKIGLALSLVVALGATVSAQSTGRSAAFAGPLTLRVTSQFGQAELCGIHIWPQGESGWGEDWMNDGERIGPGASRDVRVRPGRYDVRVQACAENEGRRAGTFLGLMISQNTELVIYPSGRSPQGSAPGGFERLVVEGEGTYLGQAMIDDRRRGAVALARGASEADVRALQARNCDAIGNRDLQSYCRGQCSAIGDQDVRALCDGRCGQVGDSNLQQFCHGNCTNVGDQDMSNLCRGNCGPIGNLPVRNYCSSL